MQRLAPRLRELRETRGLSQRELADLAGIDIMQVNRYERGIHLPSLETTVKLAQIFGISTDELIGIALTARQLPEIQNLKLFQRFRALDRLPRPDQDVVLQLVDAFIAKRRMEVVLSGREFETESLPSGS